MRFLSFGGRQSKRQRQSVCRPAGANHPKLACGLVELSLDPTRFFLKSVSSAYVSPNLSDLPAIPANFRRLCHRLAEASCSPNPPATWSSLRSSPTHSIPESISSVYKLQKLSDPSAKPTGSACFVVGRTGFMPPQTPLRPCRAFARPHEIQLGNELSADDRPNHLAVTLPGLALSRRELCRLSFGP